MTDVKQRWLDQYGNVVWSRPRIYICKVIDHTGFEMLMSGVIVFNIVLIILETDLEALCYPAFADNLPDCPYTDAKSQPWIKVANTLLLVLYTVEAAARVFVERRRYLGNPWNLLDAFIVTTGWASMVLGSVVNVAFLRFFRIARLARVMRVFIAFRELYLLLVGLISAMRTIVWGALMMFGMLLLWSIIMVEIVHPVNCTRVPYDTKACERCGRAFSDVMTSVLTLFQTIIAGDAWGTVAVAVIEEEPLTAGLFVMALLTVSLGLTNLILAVIVERAAEARERDLEEKLKQKEKMDVEQKKHLFDLCRQMDADGGGTLCLTELLEAYDDLPDFKTTLQMMDIEKDELKAVFKVLDKDGSGDVDYKEFCDQLHQIRTRDTRTMLTFIKLAISDLKDELDTVKTSLVDRDIVSSIMERMESGGFLRQHGKMLESIEGRLHTLAESGLGNRGPHNAGGGGPRPPIAPPQPTGAAAARGASAGARLPTSESLLDDIHRLGQQTQELAGLKGVIVRRVEDQVATLTRQAGALASIGVSVKSGTRLPDQGVPGLSDAHIGRVNEKLGRLQDNMYLELTGLLRNVEEKLEDGAATLARNNELLTSLSNDLGCELPAQDSKQRGSAVHTSERKAGASRPGARCVQDSHANLIDQAKHQRADRSETWAPFAVCASVDKRQEPPAA